MNKFRSKFRLGQKVWFWAMGYIGCKRNIIRGEIFKVESYYEKDIYHNYWVRSIEGELTNHYYIEQRKLFSTKRKAQRGVGRVYKG